MNKLEFKMVSRSSVMKNIPDSMKEQLRQLTKLLKSAERTLAEGGDVDVVSLDQRMAEICHNVDEMPLEIQPEVTPIINNLSNNLMELSVALKHKAH